MQITREFINELKQIDQEIENENQEISQQIKECKKSDKKRQVNRGKDENNKDDIQEVSESLLWQEVQQAGRKTGAYDALKGIYPELFKKIEDNDEKGNQLRQKVIDNMGFTFQQMTLTRLFDLMDEIVDLKLKEKGLIFKEKINE